MTDSTIPPMKPPQFTFDPTEEEKKWAEQEAAKLVKYGDEEAIVTMLLATRCTARQAFLREGYAANDRAERMLAALDEIAIARIIAKTQACTDVGDASRFPCFMCEKTDGCISTARAVSAALHDLLASVTNTQPPETTS